MQKATKLNITVHIEYVPELPLSQQIAWEKYYQKLFSQVMEENSMERR